MSERMRIDKALLERGCFQSRSDAQAALSAGKVYVNGVCVSKASMKVGPDDDIQAERAHPFVSRAALKLQGALECFPIEIDGRQCLDVGCSTGGFTEVLLLHGAAHIVAVDVGQGQFHTSLRGHDRVCLLEQTDARSLNVDHIKVPPDLIVCDASFIGLEKVLAAALKLASQQADLIALFKPQFQVGPKSVGKGGIVTDEDAIERARTECLAWLEREGWEIKDWQPSSVKGSDGNQEYLLWARRNAI